LKTFVYLLHPCRPTLIDDGTPEEFEKVGEHFEYLKELLDAGRLVLAGPCEDGAFGIAIFYAEDIAAAEQVVSNDPAISCGLMTAELHAYRISLMR